MGPKQNLLIVSLVAGGLVLLYGPGFIRWVELKSEQGHLKTEVSYLQMENGRLYQESRRLREDPAYAEAVARRQLGFTRPGETVIKFRATQKKELSRR